MKPASVINPRVRFYSRLSMYEKGRKPVSHTLLNRMHFMFMEPYSSIELQAIAHANHIPNPRAMAQAFFRVKKDYPEKTNSRTFFTAVNRVKPIVTTTSSYLIYKPKAH